MTMGKLFDKLLNRKKERHPRCAALVPAAGRFSPSASSRLPSEKI